MNQQPSFLEPFAGSSRANESPSDWVWPIPLERTVSYGGGTGRAPAAIVHAGGELERFDEELGCPIDWDIHVLPAVEDDGQPIDRLLERIDSEATAHYRAHPFVMALGGEHTLTIPLVRAAARVFGPLGVLQIDAHADLRPHYMDQPWSHACVMHHVRALGVPTVSVGIRSLSELEAVRVRNDRIPIVWAHEISRAPDNAWIDRVVDLLPSTVYVTLDVDGFDPGVFPGTGTPEPGGLGWWQGLALLRRVCECRRVVAADIVETVPQADVPTSEFAAARLALKLMVYRRCASSQARNG